MIVPSFAAMRGTFAAPGAVVAADGYLTFPGVAYLRAAGFSSLVTPTITSYPITLTCNAGAPDAVPGVHEYDWWASARTSTLAAQPFAMTHQDPTKSGTVSIALNAGNIAALLPGVTGAGLLTADALATIFRDCAIYVSRRSDRAYQWIRMVAP